MIVRFGLGNITETLPAHGKLDHLVSAGRKRDGFKQLHVSVEFYKIRKHVISRARGRPDRSLLGQLTGRNFCM